MKAPLMDPNPRRLCFPQHVLFFASLILFYSV